MAKIKAMKGARPGTAAYYKAMDYYGVWQQHTKIVRELKTQQAFCLKQAVNSNTDNLDASFKRQRYYYEQLAIIAPIMAEKRTTYNAK
ncbi:MAG: hypothetical protein ACRBFS_10480 [Aureispira sp.]